MTGAPGVRSDYRGPTRVARFGFRGREVLLERPDDPDRLLNDPGVLRLNQRDDYMPYWAYLWPGAFLLAEAVAREDWPPGARALEIGCGLGLAGLVALKAGLAHVCFTDYDRAPLEFVARSAALNGFAAGRFETRALDWRERPVERWPVILGADVLYERRLVPLVADLIQALLAPDGAALLAGPYRVATEDLPACLEPRGLVIAEATPLEARDDHGRPVRGILHRVRHAFP